MKFIDNPVASPFEIDKITPLSEYLYELVSSAGATDVVYEVRNDDARVFIQGRQPMSNVTPVGQDHTSFLINLAELALKQKRKFDKAAEYTVRFAVTKEGEEQSNWSDYIVIPPLTPIQIPQASIPPTANPKKATVRINLPTGNIKKATIKINLPPKPQPVPAPTNVAAVGCPIPIQALAIASRAPAKVLPLLPAQLPTTHQVVLSDPALTRAAKELVHSLREMVVALQNRVSRP